MLCARLSVPLPTDYANKRSNNLMKAMKTEIIPEESSRAEAYRMWMSSPVPMLTFVKTLDVSRLVKVSKRTGIKFNTLMCWCIGKAADGIEEFHVVLEKDKLFRYDRFSINVIVNNCQGGINNCDIPFSDDLQQFYRDYQSMTAQVANECRNITLDGYAVIGTSAIIQTELDCIVNQYTGIYTNPFICWSRYRKHLFKTTLPVSIQFHHVQMDGGHAARFLQCLQDVIKKEIVIR